MLPKYNLVVKLVKSFHFDLQPKNLKFFLQIITSSPTSQNQKQQPFLSGLNIWTLENLGNDKVGKIKSPSHNTPQTIPSFIQVMLFTSTQNVALKDL